MLIRKTFMASLIMTAATSVFATPSLFTTNCADHPSTSIINGGMCSDNISGGTTNNDCVPHEVKGTIVSLACIGHKSDCVADVYMTDHCGRQGEAPIGTVHFDVTGKGFIRADNVKDPYIIKGDGFNITLSKK